MTGRVLRSFRRPVVLAAAAVSVLGGASTAAASDWLEVFQTADRPSPRGVIAVSAIADDVDVDVAGDVTIREVADARSATAQTGLAAPVVTALPRGVTGDPTYSVVGEVSIRFTERTTVDANALPPPTLDGATDGATIQVEAGPGIAAVWSQPLGVPRLVVARTPVPVVTSSGGSLEVMPDDHIPIPGLPSDVASHLGTFAANLLPIPIDQITTETADVNGRPATAVATPDRSFAAVVWATDGIVTVVAGSLDADEILSVARSLQ
jgi:hypothetical protein